MSFLVYDAMIVISLYHFCFGLSLLDSYPLCWLVLYYVDFAVSSYVMDCLMICVVTVLL